MCLNTHHNIRVCETENHRSPVTWAHYKSSYDDDDDDDDDRGPSRLEIQRNMKSKTNWSVDDASH